MLSGRTSAASLRRCFLLLEGLLAALVTTTAAHADDDWLTTRLRMKAFGAEERLPTHDLQRARYGRGRGVADVAARGELSIQSAGFGFDGALEVVAPLGAQAPRSGADGVRFFDLETPIRGSHANVRLDRLALTARGEQWNVAVGRQAVTWGNGQVFSPFDLFAPFAPTETDRDFKAGDDMVLAQTLFSDGSDLQLVGVARRDVDGRRHRSANSVGAKYRFSIDPAEFNVLLGQHAGERVLGVGASRSVGGAVIRSDLLATDPSGGGWRFSWVANVDYSFELAEHNVYVFGEVFRNGFAAPHLTDFSSLPRALRERLQRGEVFSLRRWTLSAGGNIEWDARVTQNFLLLLDPYDFSALAQTSIAFVPDDRQTFELGVTFNSGDRGDAFGPLALSDALRLTAGGSDRLFLRYVVYW